MVPAQPVIIGPNALFAIAVLVAIVLALVASQRQLGRIEAQDWAMIALGVAIIGWGGTTAGRALGHMQTDDSVHARALELDAAGKTGADFIDGYAAAVEEAEDVVDATIKTWRPIGWVAGGVLLLWGAFGARVKRLADAERVGHPNTPAPRA